MNNTPMPDDDMAKSIRKLMSAGKAEADAIDVASRLGGKPKDVAVKGDSKKVGVKKDKKPVKIKD